jgi:hypothetical protein
VVQTDHFALKYLLDQRLSIIPQHTWVSKLFVYDFRVEYLPGKANIIIDALSRRDEHSAMALPLSSPTFELYNELREELGVVALGGGNTAKGEDREGRGSNRMDRTGWPARPLSRIFVPTASALWPTILATAHGAGHEGVQKTLHCLHASFYSTSAAQLVKDFIKSCTVCQRNKSEHLHPAGLLQPLEPPGSVWADIAIDFVEGFPRVGGKSVVMTGVDRFSKYAHFIPFGHPYTAVSVAQAFFDNIVKLHGILCSIVSDRDPVFTSTFWKELFTLSGIKLRMSTAFHPQTDG